MVGAQSGFPGGLDGKDSACSVRDQSSVPGWGRSSGEGPGYPLKNPVNITWMKKQWGPLQNMLVLRLRVSAYNLVLWVQQDGVSFKLTLPRQCQISTLRSKILVLDTLITGDMAKMVGPVSENRINQTSPLSMHSIWLRCYLGTCASMGDINKYMYFKPRLNFVKKLGFVLNSITVVLHVSNNIGKYFTIDILFWKYPGQ